MDAAESRVGTPEQMYNVPVTPFRRFHRGEQLHRTNDDWTPRWRSSAQFKCLDAGFWENEPVDVVIRPEDVDIVAAKDGMLTGTVANVTFKGVHYDVIVDFKGFKWLIQTTDYVAEGSHIGIKIDPDGIHVMRKSQYSGKFGDYSSYSAEYDEISNVEYEPEEELSEEALYEA
jgi:spermidine/putrescine transport system ATP-binding protein